LCRLPLNQVGSLGKIHKVSARFEQENERDPSAEELAEVLEMPVEKVSGTLRVSGRSMSIDAPFSDGEDNSLLDVLENKDSLIADSFLMKESLAKEIQRTLSVLSDKERSVLECYFGIGCPEMSLEAIGEELGLTKERTRQIKEKALKRLRHKSKSKLLKKYLG
jgi:RNA polymerase primary sigma factor